MWPNIWQVNAYSRNLCCAHFAAKLFLIRKMLAFVFRKQPAIRYYSVPAWVQKLFDNFSQFVIFCFNFELIQVLLNESFSFFMVKLYSFASHYFLFGGLVQIAFLILIQNGQVKPSCNIQFMFPSGEWPLHSNLHLHRDFYFFSNQVVHGSHQCFFKWANPGLFFSLFSTCHNSNLN